jgi:hypothetical protein
MTAKMGAQQGRPANDPGEGRTPKNIENSPMQSTQGVAGRGFKRPMARRQASANGLFCAVASNPPTPNGNSRVSTSIPDVAHPAGCEMFSVAAFVILVLRRTGAETKRLSHDEPHQNVR